VELNRQERPARAKSKERAQPPSRVPEEHPPLLGDWFIYLSVVVLVAGVVAITAFELGSALTSAFVRFPALVAAGLLIILAADAALVVWRSAWAWLPVDRGRGLFRFVWAAVMVAVLLASIATVLLLVAA
jgi:hypothetical protein